MKTSELVKMLKKAGCTLHREGANHDIWYSPLTGKYFTLWRHPSKEVPTGTVRSIMKDAGLK